MHAIPPDMLLWIAVGDAYGACFEYADADATRPNDLSGYPPNIVYPAIGGGRYTDDAQMSAALAEAVLGGPLTRESVAEAFVARFKLDARMGYSRGMQALMSCCIDGEDLLRRIHPVKNTSGAAMRVLPVAALSDVSSVMAAADLQASVTHDTPGGIASATAAAMMAFGMRSGVTAPNLPKYVFDHVPGDWMRPWQGPVGSAGVDAVRAALWTVATAERSMASALRRAVDLTGDVDTVAAIALGTLACDPHTLRDIPASLVHGLENGDWGRDYLEELGGKLSEFSEAAILDKTPHF